jgi:hypothetical protein
MNRLAFFRRLALLKGTFASFGLARGSHGWTPRSLRASLRRAVWGLGLALFLGGSAFIARGGDASPARLQLIPQPHQWQATGPGFEAPAARCLCVTEGGADRFAARLVRDSLRETHGIDCELVALAQPNTNTHRLWLGTSTNLPAALDDPLPPSDEGYRLQVTPKGVLLVASGEAGLFYGGQTLIQLLEQAQRDHTPIPGAVITDVPTFAWRGRYFDGSQYLGSVVVTRANLERELKLLARFKLNCLCFDAYNLVPFKSFPACADGNTLSLADWEALVELAHRYHVTLIPSLQSFAQIYQVIWNCDAGKPFREETAPGLICPSRPENIRFLQGLYRDLMGVFRYTPILGIGCSEVDMQWQKHYCPRCRQRIDRGETLHQIYTGHVRACAQAVDAAARESGRSVRPMMWADEFYCGYGNERWVGIDSIPTNTVMGHWQYWSRYQNLATQKTNDYDGISGLLQRGFDVFFLSASFEFNTYLHDLSPKDPTEGKWNVLYDSGIYNIADQARWAQVYQRQSGPGRVLGGGCATFSQHDIRCWDTTWFAYALQGEYSWGNPDRPLPELLPDFIEAFAATFYGARDRQAAQEIAAAYRELDSAKSDLERNNYLIRDIIGEFDIHDAAYIDNTLEGSLKLIGELGAHPKGPGKSLADVHRRAEHVREVAAVFRHRLAPLVSRVQNVSSFHFLLSAAHKIENHAQRTLFLLDLASALAEAGSKSPANSPEALRQTLASLEERCVALEADTRFITDEMDELAHGAVGQLSWDGAGTGSATVASAADTTGYHKVLASLREFRSRIRGAQSQAAPAVGQPLGNGGSKP